MRLRDIQTLEEANLFLEQYWPLYNRKFAVSPLGNGDLHRDLSRGLNLDQVLCVKAGRALRNDFTIAYHNKLYQIEDHIRASKVIVQKRPHGSIVITYKDRFLKFRGIATRPAKEKKHPVRLGPKKRNTPPQDHYWRNFKFGRRRYDAGIFTGSRP